MTKLLVALLTTAAIFCPFTNGRAGAEQTLPEDPVLAEVNGKAIRSSELQLWLTELPSDSQLDPNTAAGKRTVLETMIDHKLLLDHAQKTGLTERPEFKRRMEAAREQLIINQLIFEKFGQQLQVSEQEALQYFEANKAAMVKPERRHVRHIVVDSEQKAHEVKAKLLKKADFEKLVEEYSDPEWKANGGDLGYIEHRNFRPEFAGPAFSLELNQFSDPIRTPVGFHIIQVLEIVPEQPIAFETIQDEIQRALLQQKQQALLSGWLSELRTVSDITVYGSNLASSANYKMNVLSLEPVDQDAPAEAQP